MSTSFMNRHVPLVAGLLGLALLLAGCFDENRPTIDEDLLQFEANTSAEVERTVSFSADEEAQDEDITIQLSGATQDTDVEAAVTVSEETTAEEGTQFELLDESVTIPAGEHFADLGVRIYPENIDLGSSVDIVPRLTGDSDLDVMENYSAYTLTVERVDNTIAGLAESDFSTLASALEEGDLVEPLRDLDREFTTFAPTNDAFEALNTDALFADSERLEAVLTNHVTEDGVLSADDLQDGQTISMLSEDEVEVAVDDDGITIDGVEVSEADIDAANGLIHALDSRPLLGNQNLASTVELLAATEALFGEVADADLGDAFAMADGWTVFGPDNDAFEGAGDVLAELDGDEVEDVLTYHTLAEEVSAADLLDELDANDGETTIETRLNGEEITVALDDGSVVLNDGQARIDDVDVIAENGVVHLIDGVLLPDEFVEDNDSVTP